MNAIEAFVPHDVVRTFSSFLEFCYIARRDVITDDSLKQLDLALKRFHQARMIFSGTVRGEGLSGFSLPRQHAMVHYHNHIKNFGSPNGLCSSITESKHIAAVKEPWRRTNKYMALPQMLKINERLDKLTAAKADFGARGMLVDSCLVQAIVKTFGSADSDDDDSDDSDDGGYSDDSDEDDDDLFLPSPPHQPLPEGPEDMNDNDDDDHGPVNCEPLMNEVRLASKKGKRFGL